MTENHEPVVPVVIIDTETDGLHVGRQAWEVAMIRREPDGTVTEREFMLPINLSTADPFGLKIGGFYDRHPMGRYLTGERETEPFAGDTPGYVTRKQAAHKVARMTHGAHIIGAVPSFDTITLEPLLHEFGLTPAWHYHLLDVENLAIGYLAAEGHRLHPPYKSDELGQLVGVPPLSKAERHTAMADTRWALAIYDAIMHGEPVGWIKSTAPVTFPGTESA